MGARQKLNSAYFTGSMLLAVFWGWLTDSLVVLVIALAIFIAVNLNNGDIRFGKRR